MKTYLQIGGLVAVGFDTSGRFLLTISHSGRGVYSSDSWERVARDYSLAYPENGVGIGIGPIAELPIPITEMDYEKGQMRLESPNGKISLVCESSGIEVVTIVA